MKIKTQAQLNIYKLCKKADINNPVTRAELMAATGLSDRMVRVNIDIMRDDGIRICATASNSGYWLAKGDEDYKIFRRYYGSPIWTSLRRLTAMDNAVEGQLEI